MTCTITNTTQRNEERLRSIAAAAFTHTSAKNHTHIVQSNSSRTDHHIPNQSSPNSEVGHRVGRWDLEIWMKADRESSGNLSILFFSTTRRLGGLGIAESAKSFPAPTEARSANSHLSTPLNAPNIPTTHSHGSHSTTRPLALTHTAHSTGTALTHRAAPHSTARPHHTAVHFPQAGHTRTSSGRQAGLYGHQCASRPAITPLR